MNLKKAKKIIKDHYRLNRLPTELEVVQEVANIKRRLDMSEFFNSEQKLIKAFESAGIL